MLTDRMTILTETFFYKESGPRYPIFTSGSDIANE